MIRHTEFYGGAVNSDNEENETDVTEPAEKDTEKQVTAEEENGSGKGRGRGRNRGKN